MKRFLFLTAALLSGHASASFCYQVVKGDEIIYQDSRPPFDISYSNEEGRSGDLRQAEARGERLVFFPGPCVPERRTGPAPFFSARSAITAADDRPVGGPRNGSAVRLRY